MMDSAEGGRIARDALANAAALGLSSAAGIVIVPLLLHSFGASLYGVYASAGALAALVAIDFGLGTAVARELALGNTSAEGDTADFIASAFKLQLALAGIAAIVLIIVSYPMTLGLSPSERQTARLIFWLVAAALTGDQVTSAAVAMLGGLRRFIFANTLVIAVAVIRVAGAIVIVRRRSAVDVIFFFAIVSLTSAIVTLAYAAARDRRIALLRPLSWRAVHARARFAGLAQVLQFAGKANWQVAVPLVTSLRGAVAGASLSIGQKFPLATMALNWRATEVLMPAATEHGSRDGNEGIRRVLVTGTRGVALIAAQPCILFVVMAQWIISLWIRTADPLATTVLRIMAVAVVVETLAYPATQVLIAVGAVGTLVRSTLGALVVNLILSIALQVLIGPRGAAVAVLVALAIMSIVIMRTAAAHVAMPVRQSLAAMLPALAPALASASVLILLVYQHPPQEVLLLLRYTFISSSVYAAACTIVFRRDIRFALQRRRARRGI